MRRTALRGTRLRIAGIGATAVCAVAALAALAGWITCSGGGGDEDFAATPIERQAPAAGWAAIDVPPLDGSYRLTATRESADGIERDTEFVLESDAGDLDASTLAARLTVDPPAELEFDGDGGRIEIRALGALREGTRYRFALRDETDGRLLRSWAFQTVSPLRIVQTLPADRSTNVPRATGIELTFSHDGVTGVDQHFTITPPVEGRFEVHKRVVVFVPKALDAETLYTITVSAGVRAGDELETSEPLSFSFETGALNEREPPSNYEALYFARLISESSTAEPPSLQVDATQTADPIRLPVEVFRFDDDRAFIDAIEEAETVPYWSIYARRAFRLDASGLDRAATFDADVIQPGPNAYERFITFPAALEPGYYLVQAEYKGELAQSLLQVTNLAAYASVSEPKTLVWVNDLATGAPIEGATVRDDDGDEHETDAAGVALFDTQISRDGGSSPSRFLRVEHGGRSAVVSFSSGMAIGYYGGYYDRSYYYDGGSSPDYWSYMYTDRSLYHPSDVVRFWGVAKHRRDFEPGARFTARLSGGEFAHHTLPGSSSSVLAETDISVSDLGTFEDELAFEGIAPGYYTLTLAKDDVSIATSYVQIQDFIKPAYKIDVEPSHRAVIAGEAVTFDVTSEFFDGSPVPFVDMAYYGPAGAVEQPITTDADGSAVVPYLAQANDAFSGPTQRGIDARPTGPEQAEIYGSGYLYVLPSALTVEATAETASGSATVNGAVHNVDLSAFDDDENSWYSTYAGAPSAGRAITASVVEVHYNQIEDGEDYDFIAKLTRKRYRYDRIEEPHGTFSATSAADGSFSFSFPVTPERYYNVEITTVDDAGRVAGERTYASGDGYVERLTYYDRSLRLQETTVRDASDEYPYSYYGSSSFAAGETVDLTVRRNEIEADTGGSYRYLFVRAQDGIRDYVSSGQPRLTWDFSADDIPNVGVSAVQFNGRGYESICCDYVAQFNPSDRAIDVEIEASAERYEPGDDVTLSVRTTDPSGTPVEAEVILSLVDEAIFRLQGGNYEQEIMQQLYRPLPSGIIQSYLPSFTALAQLQSRYSSGYLDSPNTGGPDTGGPVPGAAAGVAPPDPRDDFRDVALFRTVRTDASGAATVTFTLPDNITSWRVTSRAVTGDLRAGAGVAEIPVGLPFFVEVTAASDYLVADRPVIGLRAFGIGLARGDAVTYRIDAPSLNISGTTVDGEAFRSASFELPSLSEGAHDVTISATSGALGDAIVHTLRIVPSRLQRGEARFYVLTSGVAIEGSESGRTRVVFTDHTRGRYYDDLLRLGYGYGDRIDQQLARAVSASLLRDYFDAQDAPNEDFEPSLYMTDQGGLALFPYADSDLTLSARAFSVAPNEFGRNAVAAYFRRVLEDPDETRERAIIALFGMAAAGEPVLASIHALAQLDDLTPRERLYLGLAALAAGDDATAREQYAAVVARYGESRAPSARIRFGVDQDDILELTALAADLGAGIGDPAAAAFFDYTQSNATTDLLVELDQISFLSRALPLLPSGDVRFAYTLRGERNEQSLEPGRSFSLDLSAAELDALAPQALEGDLGVASFFQASFDPAAAVIDPDITLRRIVDLDGGGIALGDVVRVRLDYTLAPQSLDGCYQITDIAPSGLRPVTRPYGPYDGAEVLTPYRIEGQRVTFCAYRNDRQWSAAYYARVVTSGAYAVEPAIIQSMQSAESFNLTAADTIVIE